MSSPSDATAPISGESLLPKQAAASGQRPSPQPRHSPQPEPERVALQPTLEAPPVPSASSQPVARPVIISAAGSPPGFVPPSHINEFTSFEPLGHGAMGQVFRAHDSLLDRAVAIKLLASENPTAQARERFLIEARAIARLQHPNVVAIHRVGLHGKRPYIVSELLPGQSLDRTPLPLSATHARSLGLGIARGLFAAHRQGVLHRDIKPSNVMVAQDGTVKLLDFGLAKLTSALAAASGDRSSAEFPPCPCRPRVWVPLPRMRPAMRDRSPRPKRPEWTQPPRRKPRCPLSQAPDFPLGHLALGEVWATLGYEERAQAAVRRAFTLAHALAPQARSQIEARFFQMNHEWERCFAVYRALRSAFPERLDYALGLAEAQLWASQPEAALLTLQTLRGDLRPAPRPPTEEPPAVVRHDPRLDLLEGRVRAALDDPPAAIALLARAAAQAQATGSPLVEARARLEAAYAYELSGAHEQALHAAEQAAPLYEGVHDRGGLADTLIAIKSVQMNQGEIEAALVTASRAQNVLMEIQNSSLLADHRGNIAILLVKRGRLEQALARAESGYLLARKLGQKEAYVSLSANDPLGALRSRA